MSIWSNISKPVSDLVDDAEEEIKDVIDDVESLDFNDIPELDRVKNLIKQAIEAGEGLLDGELPVDPPEPVQQILNSGIEYGGATLENISDFENLRPEDVADLITTVSLAQLVVENPHFNMFMGEIFDLMPFDKATAIAAVNALGAQIAEYQQRHGLDPAAVLDAFQSEIDAIVDFMMVGLAPSLVEEIYDDIRSWVVSDARERFTTEVSTVNAPGFVAPEEEELEEYVPQEETTALEEVAPGIEEAVEFVGDENVNKIDYSASDAGVFVNLKDGTGNGGHAEGGTFVNIENITGSGHNDHLVGNQSDNKLDGGSGDDLLEGKSGNDGLYGRIGNDTLLGGAGQDFLNGGQGSDQMYGGVGDDVILGGPGGGADELWGESGNDTLIGGAGRDTFHESSDDGADYIDGGSGYDKVIFEGLIDDYDVENLGDGNWIVTDAKGDKNTLISIEEIVFDDWTLVA